MKHTPSCSHHTHCEPVRFHLLTKSDDFVPQLLKKTTTRPKQVRTKKKGHMSGYKIYVADDVFSNRSQSRAARAFLTQRQTEVTSLQTLSHAIDQSEKKKQIFNKLFFDKSEESWLWVRVLRGRLLVFWNSFLHHLL
jgi:hypothetical protein